MKIAFISDEEIIPFDNIEAVGFDLINETPVADIVLSNKDMIRVSGRATVPRFKSEYIEYLKMMSKAAAVLEDL